MDLAYVLLVARKSEQSLLLKAAALGLFDDVLRLPHALFRQPMISLVRIELVTLLRARG